MLLLRKEPLGMFAVSSFGFRLASSSVGVLLLLRSPWLTESSTASGRFARKIDTVAFPSATNKSLCSNGLAGEHVPVAPSRNFSSASLTSYSSSNSCNRSGGDI
jgi:hypothetical protein